MSTRDLFDTIADVGSDEEEDEDFDGEAGEAGESRPKKTNGTNGIDDSSEEEDDDDEDRLRQASLPVLTWLSGSANQFSGR
jgi:transcription elongation factor SPT6